MGYVEPWDTMVYHRCSMILLTRLALASRGPTSITWGLGSRLMKALCCGVPGIIENTQRMWGASLRGTQFTRVAAVSSSNWLRASTMTSVGREWALFSAPHAIWAALSMLEGILVSWNKMNRASQDVGPQSGGWPKFNHLREDNERIYLFKSQTNWWFAHNCPRNFSSVMEELMEWTTNA